MFQPLIRRLCVPSVVLLANAALVVAQGPTDCDPAGRWVNADKVLTIEIGSADGKWFGKVLRSSDPEVPVGFALMKDFRYDTKDREFKGKIARPSGREVGAAMRCEKDGTLKVTGGVAFVKKTIVWHRERTGH